MSNSSTFDYGLFSVTIVLREELVIPKIDM